MTKKAAAAIDRRDFFRKASLGAGVAGAAVAGLSASKVKAGELDAGALKGAGYQETAHVKKFYELARQ